MSVTEMLYCVIVHAGFATATEAANPSGACSARTVASGSGVAASQTLAPRTLTRASDRVHASMKRRSRLSSERIVSISSCVKKRLRIVSAFGTARSCSTSTPTGATRVTAIIDTSCECEMEKCSAGSLRSSGFPLGASYNSIFSSDVSSSAASTRRVASRTVVLSPLSSVRTRTSPSRNAPTASFTQTRPQSRPQSLSQSLSQSLELDQFDGDSTIGNRHDGDAGSEVESSGTCGARIDRQAAGKVEDQLFVRVGVYYDIRVRVGSEQLLRLGPTELAAVTHVKAEVFERLFERQRKIRIVDGIAIPGDGVDRG